VVNNMNLQANFRQNKIGELKEDVQVLSSLEVAEMVGREHKNVMRDILNIASHLGGLVKVEPTYFVESSYINSQNKEMPCFLLTKKGCELYGTRMTGAKGTQFAVAYIERFNSMEQELSNLNKPSYQIEDEILRAERWIQEQKEKKELLLLVEEQKPKVLFAEAITASKDSILLRDFVTLLTQNGIDTGEKRLFDWMRENKYLKKSGKYNVPTQKSNDKKLFELLERPLFKNGSEVGISLTPKLTTEGQSYFIKKFLKYNI